jgi:hypothetical protein
MHGIPKIEKHSKIAMLIMSLYFGLVNQSQQEVCIAIVKNLFNSLKHFQTIVL